MNVTLDAGGPSDRTDILWADVDPDAGTWELNVISTGDEQGRMGVPLAQLDVPANMNATSVAKTIYAMRGTQPSDSDELVGYIESPALAAKIVAAFNEIQNENSKTENEI